VGNCTPWMTVRSIGLCHTVPVRRLVSALAVALIAAVSVPACIPPIGGKPVVGPTETDPAYFFAGDIPAYGRAVNTDDITYLAYLRALRRIDVCGLLTGATLAKVGQTFSVGTLFAFDECDAELKVSGVTDPRLLSVQLTMSLRPDEPPDFRVGDTAVYRTDFQSCNYLVVLDLARLPGARPLISVLEPFVQVSLFGPQDCDLTRRIAGAVAARLSAQPLPPRDAAATYPVRLAERDPCEVLAPLGGTVDLWDVPGSGPYRCRFGVTDGGGSAALEVRLEPRMVDAVTASQRLDEQGVEVYLDPVLCSAVSFMGSTMQRKVIGRGYVDLADVVIRPAVVVDTGGHDCAAVTDVAIKAAHLYA
jgi:hypothetical protein